MSVKSDLKNDPLFPPYSILKQLLEGTIQDPHSILGMHNAPDGSVLVRVFDPGAESVTLLTETRRYPMRKLHDGGLFGITFPRRKKHFAYRLEKR